MSAFFLSNLVLCSEAIVAPAQGGSTELPGSASHLRMQHMRRTAHELYRDDQTFKAIADNMLRGLVDTRNAYLPAESFNIDAAFSSAYTFRQHLYESAFRGNPHEFSILLDHFLETPAPGEPWARSWRADKGPVRLNLASISDVLIAAAYTPKNKTQMMSVVTHFIESLNIGSSTETKEYLLDQGLLPDYLKHTYLVLFDEYRSFDSVMEAYAETWGSPHPHLEALRIGWKDTLANPGLLPHTLKDLRIFALALKLSIKNEMLPHEFTVDQLKDAHKRFSKAYAKTLTQGIFGPIRITRTRTCRG
jgi:hypothetical protein